MQNNTKIIQSEVVSNIKIANDTFLITFFGNSDWIKPGKFINIKIENKFLRRPMSIFKIDKNKFATVYKVIGDGTKILSQVQAKQKLDLLIDLGNNYSLVDNDDILIIAGGCGIGSIFDLIKEYKSRKINLHVVIGFKTKQDVFFYEEIKKLTNNVYYCTEDGSIGEKGNIIEIIRKYKLQNHYYYVCGSNNLLKAVYSCCKQGQLSLECRMGCGYGVCMGCSIMTKNGSKRVCVEGPIFESKDLLW